jgi:putative transposase
VGFIYSLPQCGDQGYASGALLSVAYAFLCLLLNVLLPRAPAARAREVELLILRHENRVLRRQGKRTPWRPGDRMLLAALSRALPRAAWHEFPVRPETLLRWHRALVTRKWAAFGSRRGPGRPPLAPEARALILRLARENPRWGYQRLRGELLALGHTVSATAIRTVLRRYHVPPAPLRTGLAWPAFLRAHAAGLVACDFFAVETVRLEVLYVLFFLHVQTRRAFVAGGTAHPTAAWVAQQARNITWDLAEAGIRPTILLRDRDAKVPPAFDTAFTTQGTRVVRAPFRAPRANAFAERWVGTIRRECLDWLLILGPRHLEYVLHEYVGHYNAARPHRALQLHPPLPRGQPVGSGGPVLRHDRLGGILREYSRCAA